VATLLADQPAGARLRTVNACSALDRQRCQQKANTIDAASGRDLCDGPATSSASKRATMAKNENQKSAEKPHRSFVVSDLSVRDAPLALLTYVSISALCVVCGLVVESLSPFWRGFLFGAAVAMAAAVGLSQILGAKPDDK
jgi:hypothetical protein